MDEFDFDSKTSFRRKYLTPMMGKGILRMTILVNHQVKIKNIFHKNILTTS